MLLTGQPLTVLYPLQKAGFISLERGTRERGRGAKPFLVAPANKLLAEILEPLLNQLEAQTGADLRPLLRKPLAEILQELTASDRHIRGLAFSGTISRHLRCGVMADGNGSSTPRPAPFNRQASTSYPWI